MTEQHNPLAPPCGTRQPYSRDDPTEHTRHFALCMLDCTWEQTLEAINSAPDDGWAVRRCESLVRNTRARERFPDRYDQLARVHDLHQGAERLTRCFDWLATARQGNAAANDRYAHMREPQQVQAAVDAMQRVKSLFDELVVVVATRWLPAAFSVARRLPLSQRREVQGDIQDRLNATLHFISRARACYEGIELESKRWLAGWGCLDLALMQVCALFKWVRELPSGFDTSDCSGRLLRDRCDRAIAELDAAHTGYMARLHRSVTDGIFHNDALMPYSIRFAERTRGRTPDLREFFADLDEAETALSTKW